MVSTRSSSGFTPRPPKNLGDDVFETPSRTSRRTVASRASSTLSTTPPTISETTALPSRWAHVPSFLTLTWMAVSLPLVAWDTGYVLLRPLSMPGGAMHWPLWVPYALYGEVDHMYGLKHWNLGTGFTAAQGLMNAVESGLYLAYLWLWWTNGSGEGIKKAISGRKGGIAALIGFGAAVMTVSKTLLYWLNEYYHKFDNIGHNSLASLVFLWIIPNGLWLVFPTIMAYQIGREIVDGLDSAPNTATIKTE